MQKIRITNKTLEQKIREYARNHQISFQQACTKLFDTGVCHPRRVRKITIIKVEVA